MANIYYHFSMSLKMLSNTQQMLFGNSIFAFLLPKIDSFLGLIRNL